MSASIREVAAAAGVSVGTVSNVLNRPDLVARATVERVQGAIDKLGFVRNDAARQLRAGRSRTIGLVVLDVRNPFFTDVALGAESAAGDRRVLIANSDDSAERENAHVDLFEEQRAMGILISPMGDDLSRLERVSARGTPVVLVDRSGEGTPFASVAVDDVAGGEIAARHLIDGGRKRLAFIGGPLSLRQVAERVEGARRAVSAAPDVSLDISETTAMSVLEGRRVGEVIRDLPVGRRPDAIFAANDLIAMGVLQALVMHGDVSVPDEISLVGYDDIDFATAAVVPISSVRQPAVEIGGAAVELLQRQAEGAKPEHILFRPELVVRESSSTAAFT